MSASVGRQMARTTGLFQALVALPPMVVMGGIAMESLFLPSIPIYDFMLVNLISVFSPSNEGCQLMPSSASTFNALFAAGIIFTVFVQRNVNMNKTITLYFEEAKSGLATGVWLWLLLDTIFGPTNHYWYYYNGPRGPRIARAAISIILLL